MISLTGCYSASLNNGYRWASFCFTPQYSFALIYTKYGGEKVIIMAEINSDSLLFEYMYVIKDFKICI